MPQNLTEQILQRIYRLSADGNSQREVARMLGVSQGCISKILQRNRETVRPHQRKRGDWMKISMPREGRQLLRMVRTNRFISAPRLRMQIIRRFGRRMSVRNIRRRLLAAGYWSRRPARCPMLTLEHRRRRHEWGRRHRGWDLRQWRQCIFSDESLFSLYQGDGRVRVRRRQGERLIDACVQPNEGNRGPSVMVWGAIHNGGRSELVVVDGAMNRHRYIQILRNQMLPWATRCLDVNLWQCPAPYSTWHGSLFGPTGCRGHVLASSESRHEPNWACLGSNVSLDPRHGWTPFHRSWTKTMLSARCGLQFGQEGCGPWSRACLVVSGLYWPLEAGTHATSVEVRRAISRSTNM